MRKLEVGGGGGMTIRKGKNGEMTKMGVKRGSER